MLAGPAVLAFFTGGYPDEPRVWAGLAAWLLAASGVLLGAPPAGRAAWTAVGALGAFAAWTLLSVLWAPLAGPAWRSGQVAALYAGALLAATLLLGRCGRRAVEPALAAGALVVAGYGLSERLLPGLLEFERSATAGGRLEQPLTYWNALGVVAAFGVVLCARLAGDLRRPAWLGAAAAAGTAPLGLALSLTVSRGALWACAAGLLALAVALPQRAQLAAILLATASGGLAALAAAPLDGPALLAALLAVMVAAAAATPALRRAAGTVRLPRRAPLLAFALVAAGFAVALAVGADERAGRPLSPGAGRLTTFQSNRYEYWRVAAGAFADHPLRGTGAGGWAVRWRAERPFAEQARDAHSLYLETAAELGIVGVLLLGAAIGGVAAAARRAERAAAAGPIALCAVWAAHVALDWDWEMPAATLPAVVAAAALLTAPRPRAAPRA